MRTTSKSRVSTARTTSCGDRAVSSTNSPPFRRRTRASRMSAWSSAARTRAGREELVRNALMLLRLKPPVAKPHDPLAKGGVLFRVGDLDDGRALGVQACEQRHDVARLPGMEVAGRLVGQDEPRAGDHGARDSHQLLLAAGELRRIEVLLGHDPEAVERIGDQRLSLVLPDVAVGQRQVEVLGNREVVQQVIALEHEADGALLEVETLLAGKGVD